MVPDHENDSGPPGPRLAKLPLGARLGVLRRALAKSAGERRTKRALFFTTASLLVGFTVGDVPGLLVCGFFGTSLYAVVLVLRMQRHIQDGVEDYQSRKG
jgi:hypothetical protein